MAPFCNIGKAVLAKALGLQKNYSEIVEKAVEVVDEELSGCGSCKWAELKTVVREGDDLFAEVVSACQNCPRRVMKTEYTYSRIYHNEKNRCGYRPRLKCNSLKLFIALHFCEVDSYGIIHHCNILDLSKQLNCDEKTVKNNLDLLRQYGYISYTKTDAHLANIYLRDIEEYYKPASQGGRGYLVVSREVFAEFLSVKSINALRICLRQLMEFDLLKNKSGAALEKTYHDLRLYLPDYCKRNVIQKATNKLSMFVTEVKDNLIKFVLKSEFDAKEKKEERLTYYQNSLRSFFLEFSDEVEEINTGIHSVFESKYSGFFEKTDSTEYVGFPLKADSLVDLAALCLQYSYHGVIKALESIYKTYVLKFVPITNMGGLVRSVITSLYGVA